MYKYTSGEIPTDSLSTYLARAMNHDLRKGTSKIGVERNAIVRYVEQGSVKNSMDGHCYS